jgi:membrane fusion protein, multidrug efflux system
MRLKPVHAWTKLIVVFTLFFIISACSGNDKTKQSAQRVVPVKIGDVMQQDIPVQINAIGNVEAYNAVSIKTLVGGEVEGVYFQEGQEVKKGDLLFKIDARPYTAALRQAEAALARDQAQAKNAEEQAKRYAVLVQKEYVSKDQYDQLRANADALAATIDADKANVDNSRLQLEYCTIRSPINGRAGTVLVNNGNVIKANDISMTTINQIVPTYVTFSVPEQNLSDIKKYTAMKELKVEAIIPGDDKRPALGELTFIDNAVDKTTGTIILKGTFPNTDRRLWPGQFVNVVLTLTTQRNAVVMPAAALQAGQQGQYVFVVKPDLTVESRPVTVARSYGDLTVVAQGVTPGEKVVTDGQLNLISGVTVELKGEQPQNAPVKSGQTGSDQPAADQANRKQKAGK